MNVGPLLTTPCVMHHYEAFVSGCMFVHVASVWEELCRSRGLDNWLVLECHMAEDGIMVDSSCCHEVEVGCEGLKWRGSAELFFVNGPFASFDPTSHFSPAGVLLWRGDGNPGTWQQAADLLAPLSSSLSSFAFSLSWPSSFIFFSCSGSLPVSSPPRLDLLCPMSYFSWHLFYLKASFFLSWLWPERTLSPFI